MKKSICAFGALIALGFSSFANAAGAPQQQCLISNYAPQFVTGHGSGSTSMAADMNTKSNWSQNASSFGGQYTFWDHAQHKSTNCNTTGGGPFGGPKTTTCIYSAQPCL